MRLVRRSLVAALAAAAVAAAVVALPASGARKSSAAMWVQSVPKAHYANLLMIASLTKADSGFNFDGYAKGKLTITVPAGWKVHVVFLNVGSLAHSLMVVPGSTKPTASHPKPAFAGATTKLPYTGTPTGRGADFTFKATKPGKYRLLCAVPGHDAAGMWDTLIVKRGAKAATATG